MEKIESFSFLHCLLNNIVDKSENPIKCDMFIVENVVASLDQTTTTTRKNHDNDSMTMKQNDKSTSYKKKTVSDSVDNQNKNNNDIENGVKLKKQHQHHCQKQQNKQILSDQMTNKDRIQINIDDGNDHEKLVDPSSITINGKNFDGDIDGKTDIIGKTTGDGSGGSSSGGGVNTINTGGDIPTDNNAKNSSNIDDDYSTKKKSRFNLGRKHKSSRKKREKVSARRERKATKTLAIVLGKL